jgi:RNA polymerase sigma-70 factor (ECF subfamily)
LNGGEEIREDGGAERRPVVYCLVPPDLAGLHEPLRRHFREDPRVEVVVESRRQDRRGRGERRAGDGAAPGGEERRRVLGAGGRRVGERRAALLEAEMPELPRRARRHADRLTFVERLEPSTQQVEDQDTARLVVRFQAGQDRDAFTTLYRRYFDRVYDYLRVVLRDGHDAEDATQQVFTTVFEALPRYERRSQPFRAWLFTIVRNHGLSTLRKSGRFQPVDPADLDEERENGGRESPEAAQTLDWLTDRDLMLFIERMPLPQRQVLMLRFLFDMGSEEVGQVLDMTPSQVRAIQSRALKFLRKRLAAIGREPRYERRSRMRQREKQALVLRRRRFALLRR